MTGLHLSGTVKLQTCGALREEVSAWLQAQGKDPDAIRKAMLLAWRDADLRGEPLSALPLADRPASNVH